MAITELNISNELVIIYQESLLIVFLDLQKAYDTADASCIPWRVMGWDQNCVAFWRSSGITKRQLQERAGIPAPISGRPAAPPRGGLASPTLFNMRV